MDYELITLSILSDKIQKYHSKNDLRSMLGRGHFWISESSTDIKVDGLQLPEGKFFKVTLKKLGEQQEYLIKRWSA
jgi:hypothetical protein